MALKKAWALKVSITFLDSIKVFYESHSAHEMMTETFEEIMPFALLLILAFSSAAFGQYSEQPLKESSSDLRSQTVLFSLEIPKEKKTYQLERSANESYFLRLIEGNKVSIRKIASREATRLDRDYASGFLKCMYEIPAEKGKCQVTLRLNMKGESQEICEKDDKKYQEISVLMTKISKFFI